MSNGKIRLVNQTRYDIGVKLMNGIERAIRAGSFTLVSKEEVEYLYSIAPSLFDKPSQLLVQEDETISELGIAETVAEATVNKEQMRKILTGKVALLKEWLDEEHAPFELEIMAEVAKEIDLPASKMALLNRKLPGRFTIE